MRLTITEEMLAALARASDKPDWLIAQVARMRAGGSRNSCSNTSMAAHLTK